MNKKGFTLTELLVVVVILGIISGLSIPIIRNLTSTFEKKKYQNYADSVLASAKIFNDSYNEDLFGHNEYGCSYITYDKMVERKILKDIEIDGVSCNSAKTYIMVTKVKDKYGYTAYIGCGKKTNGKVTNITTKIPSTIPDMNHNACTGVNPNNLSIEADLNDTTVKGDKNRKKTKLTITSGTGIDNNIAIYGKWTQNAADRTNEGFTKIDFKVKGNQEETLLNGNYVSTTSRELITPKGNGNYYLVVRVDNLKDLHGESWKNPDNPNSKYIVYGPFFVDNIAPSIIVDVYKCGSDNKKTGTVLKSVDIVSGSTNTVISLADIANNHNGWLNKEYYPKGVCFDFRLTDDFALNSGKFEWNATNKTEGASEYKKLVDSENASITSGSTSQTYSTYIGGDGHRYVRFTAKDLAGNKTAVDIDFKLDKVSPNAPTITNPKNNTWTNKSVTISFKANDDMSGIGEYYYTYNSNATEFGTNDGQQWVRLTKGSDQTSFSDDWNADRNNTMYAKVCDRAGNCSTSETTIVKIDKTPPTIKTTTYARKSDGSNGTAATNGSKKVTSGTSAADNTLNLANSTTSGWFNGTDYTHGVNFAIELEDNLELNTGKFQWNATNKKENASGYTTLTGSEDVNIPNNAAKVTHNTYVAADGHRYAKVTATDKAGNTTSMYIDFKIDRTAPGAPTITNPKNNTWTNQPVSISFAGSDTMSGIGEYYYTYNSSATEFGTNDGQQWVRLTKGSDQPSFSDEWKAERDGTLYAKVCDKAGNCSSSSTTTIKIDTTPPSISAKSYRRNSNGTNGSNTGISKAVSSGTSSSSNTMDLSNATDNYNGWLNKSEYPYGVNLDITISDKFLNSATFEWNGGGYSAGEGANLTNSTSVSIPTNATSKTYSDYFESDGRRYAKMTVKDKAGNTTAMYFDMLIDNTPPDCYFETWDEYDEDGVDVGTWCDNAGPSGCASNYYTFYDKTYSFEDNVHDNAGNYGYCWISIEDYDCGQGYSSYLHHESMNGRESCSDACGGSKMVSNLWNGNVKIDPNCGAGDCHYCDRSGEGTTGMVCCECYAGWIEATCYYHP